MVKSLAIAGTADNRVTIEAIASKNSAAVNVAATFSQIIPHFVKTHCKYCKVNTMTQNDTRSKPRKVKELRCRTTRYQKSSLPYMAKLLLTVDHGDTAR